MFKRNKPIWTDTTSLTGMLMDYINTGDLASIEPNDVKPFLINRLRWRVRTAGSDRNLRIDGCTNLLFPR